MRSHTAPGNACPSGDGRERLPCPFEVARGLASLSNRSRRDWTVLGGQARGFGNGHYLIPRSKYQGACRMPRGRRTSAPPAEHAAARRMSETIADVFNPSVICCLSGLESDEECNCANRCERLWRMEFQAGP